MSAALDPALAALWASSVVRPLEAAERLLEASPPERAAAVERLRAAERSLAAAAAALRAGDPLRPRLDAVRAGIRRAADAPVASGVAALRRVAADLLADA